MPMLQLTLWRPKDTITPEKGQEVLAEINKEAKNATATGPWGVCKLDGLTVHDSPWPEWLVKLLQDQMKDLVYQPLNFMYTCDFKEQADAVAAMNWATESLRAWAAIALTPEQNKVLACLTARVLASCDDAESLGLDEY